VQGLGESGIGLGLSAWAAVAERVPEFGASLADGYVLVVRNDLESAEARCNGCTDVNRLSLSSVRALVGLGSVSPSAEKVSRVSRRIRVHVAQVAYWRVSCWPFPGRSAHSFSASLGLHR